MKKNIAKENLNMNIVPQSENDSNNGSSSY